MDRNYVGMLAESKAGHDKGLVYVIIDADGTYVYLADGRIRTVENPKKKREKHVQLIKAEHDITVFDNAAVKHMIKEYSRNV